MALFSFFPLAIVLTSTIGIISSSSDVTTESGSTTTTPKSVHFVSMSMDLERAITLVLVIFAFLLTPIFSIQLMAKRATRMLDLSKRLSADGASGTSGANGGAGGSGNEGGGKKPSNKKKKAEKESDTDQQQSSFQRQTSLKPSSLGSVGTSPVKQPSAENNNSPALMDYGSAVMPIKKIESGEKSKDKVEGEPEKDEPKKEEPEKAEKVMKVKSDLKMTSTSKEKVFKAKEEPMEAKNEEQKIAASALKQPNERKSNSKGKAKAKPQKEIKKETLAPVVSKSSSSAVGKEKEKQQAAGAGGPPSVISSSGVSSTSDVSSATSESIKGQKQAPEDKLNAKQQEFIGKATSSSTVKQPPPSKKALLAPSRELSKSKLKQMPAKKVAAGTPPAKSFEEKQLSIQTKSE